MLLAVALFVLVNITASEFNHTWDLTAENLYTLTPQSHQFLRELQQDITLTLIAPAGTEEPMLVTILEEYANASSLITVNTRDPMLSPAFLQGFSSDLEGGMIPNHSIIVQSSTQYRVITPDLMFTLLFDAMGQVEGIASVNFERQITTAIHTVTQGQVATLYYITGSGEAPLEPPFIAYLETENFIVRNLDALALMRDGIPADADILILSAPQRDWPTEKADRILAFLEDNGRALIVLEPQHGNRKPNFDRVLAAYGIRASDFYIMDADTRNHIMFPMFILPDLWPHEIFLPLALDGRMNVLLAFASAIELMEIRRHSLEFDLLMTTSTSAFGRVNPEIESFLFHPEEDQPGPFIIATTIIDANPADWAQSTELVVISSGAIWEDHAREIIGDNNFAFVASSLRWLTGQGSGLFIPPRMPPGAAQLDLNQFQANMIAGFSVGILPLIIIAAGTFTWYRRKNR
jgi:ABC-2 type transport system permease protein